MEYKRKLISIFPYFLAVLSGVLIAFSMPGYNINLLAWIELIPLLFAINNKPPKQSFFLGLITGFSVAVLIFDYMILVSVRFIGKTSIYGVLGFIFLLLYYGLWFGLITYFYTKFMTVNRKVSFIWRMFTFSAIWISIEWIHSMLLQGIPWTFFFLGYSQWENPFLLQLSSISGVFGISFIIVIFNLLLFESFQKKTFKFAGFALILMIILHLTGFVMKSLGDKDKGKPVKVALIQENIDSLTRWNETTGDSLANIFHSLCSEATTHDPDLIVWSEAAIPWTFQDDDHLILKALELTYSAKAGHIIGIISEVKNRKKLVYNSAFYFHPDGRATERYDKTVLLSVIEGPLFNWSFFKNIRLPIYRSSHGKKVIPGERQRLMRTPYGKAGLLICNESVSIHPARKATNLKADFLVTMSNDSWFENTILIDCHFALTRFRAVENSRDVVINSNRGISGTISSTGKVTSYNISDNPRCIVSTIYHNDKKTIYSRFGDRLPVFGVVFIVISFIIKRQR